MAKTKTPTPDTKLRDLWLERLTAEKKAHAQFQKDAKEADGAYRDDRADKKKTLFPLFWSTVQIIHAAIFSNAPKPDVRRRYSDMQGPQKVMAQCVQRALEYMIDNEDFVLPAHRATNDFIVTGLGQARIVYEAKTADEPVINPVSGEPVMEEAAEGETPQPMVSPVVAYQGLRLEFFSFDRFHWEPAKDWPSVGWVGFDLYMSKAEIEQQFGVSIKAGKEGGSGESDPNLPKGAQKYQPLYVVTEIWDKVNRRVIHVSDCYEEILRDEPDKLNLRGFFPCPMPMMDNIRSDEWTPSPDYRQVREQFDLVNKLSARIVNLTEQVKDVGFYDAQLSELSKLMGAPDGTLVPVQNVLERLNKAGANATFDAVVAKQDNSTKVQTIALLNDEREKWKTTIFETIGIPDIVRGATKAAETATAQQLKGQWASVRLTQKQEKLQGWFRDLFRIMGELIAEHFTIEQLQMMTGVEITPEMKQALQSDVLRCYSIDIETDSTASRDKDSEQQAQAQFVQSFSQLVESVMAGIAQGTMPAGLGASILKMAASSSKYGAQLEDELEQLQSTQQQVQGLQQQVQQGQQQTQQVQAQSQQQIAQLQQALQESQKQLQALSDENAQLQSQVDQVSQIEAASKAQASAAQARKAEAEATLKQVQAAKEAATPISIPGVLQ